MQIKSKPITQEFPLITDPDKLARITIKQATFGEDKQRADSYAVSQRYWKEGVGMVIEQNENKARLIAREIYLTMIGGSGFLKDGKEVFAFKNGKLDMTEGEFYVQLDELDGGMVKEMSDCVYKVNPTWGTPSDASEAKKAAAEKETNDNERGEAPEGE